MNPKTSLNVVHANEYGEQILSKILMAFWTSAADRFAKPAR